MPISEKKLLSQANYRKNNKEKIKAYRTKYRQTVIQPLWEKEPWRRSYHYMKTRCSSHPRYNGVARKICCYLTLDEMKQLWFRDKAWLLNKPSIDRIDTDGNYTYENCRFIELKENMGRKRSHRKLLTWALNYTKCIECGTTETKHRARGLCRNCYERKQWHRYYHTTPKKHYETIKSTEETHALPDKPEATENEVIEVLQEAHPHIVNRVLAAALLKTFKMERR